MQSEAPDLDEPGSGIIRHEGALRHRCEGETDDFGRQCLLARRFAEPVCDTSRSPTGYKWDQHKDLVDGHNKSLAATDRPIAGLLKDLKGRGLIG
jgi:hypothetical protein